MENKQLGIVFGSETTKIVQKEKGLIYNDLDYVCVDKKTGQIISIGKEAKQMYDRVSDPLAVIKLVINGSISDLQIFEAMVDKILSPLSSEIKDSDIIIAMRVDANDANKDFLTRVLSKYNPKSVNFVPNIILAGIGSGANIEDSYGSIIVELGFSKATVGIVADGEIISFKSTTLAEDYLNNQINIFFKEKYSIVVDDEEIDKVKYSLGSVIKLRDELELIVSGRDLLTNEKKKIVVNDSDVKKVFTSLFSNYRNMITSVLESAPAYIRTGIVKNGIYVTGNISKIHGVKDYFHDFFEIPTTISKYGGLSVIEGTIGYKIEN